MAAILEGRREESERRLAARIPERWPDEHDARFLRLRLGQARQRPEDADWLARAIVLREQGEMIGHAGFHGPPGSHGLPDGVVEIGDQWDEEDGLELVFERQ